MRRVSCGSLCRLGLALVLLSACAEGGGEPQDTAPSPSIASLYLSSAASRRAALVASLVNPNNTYSALRLAYYDTGTEGDWSRLPESNPRTVPLDPNDLDLPGGAPLGIALGDDAEAIAIDEAALAGDESALVTLGEEAFFHYPVQVSTTTQAATLSRAAFEGYGFWVDEVRGAGGVVREQTPDGRSVFAFTCSTCHAASRGGALFIGVGNAALDIGQMTVDATPSLDPNVADNLLAWGPGRLDVTTLTGTEPVRLADTRPAAWLTFLQADATVAVTDIMALAIRIETLIITSHAEQDRPPHVIALALATYLESLAASLPAPSPSGPSETRGAALFLESCSGCHTPPSFTGPPVALDVVGTNPIVGDSLARGTGTYRVPSLRGVSTRGPLLHDASLAGLGAMFDPSRTSAAYRGGRLGPGAVPGHTFGLDLGDEDRVALLSYLETL
jgi:mono/diheme cytochrome c family protein